MTPDLARLDGRRLPRVADRRSRPASPGATSASSRHLAEEWRAGLDARRLFERAGVLAPANDLLVATGAVARDVVAARRALARLLGRPVGQSGSGPTCWVLYPSLPDAAGRGRCESPTRSARATCGCRAATGPFVAATTIVGGENVARSTRRNRIVPLDGAGTAPTRGGSKR